MQEEKDKLPLDAKLLSEAVIELNISRRSVGIYPSDHPIVKDSIERAFGYLKKLFEVRSSITLGIAKDTLVIDEYSLDKKNPVFMEFANALHMKGIAAATFISGLSKDELIQFHSLLTVKDVTSGKALIETAKQQNITHIQLVPIDFSALGFVEGTQKPESTSTELWEEYLYGLLEGKLSQDGQNALAEIPPSDMASVVNTIMSADAREEAYDKVITGYIRKKGERRLSSESLGRFVTFIDELKPEIKKKFLTRSVEHITDDITDVEAILKNMNTEDFQRITEFFTDHSSVLPDTLKNLIHKLAGIKKGGDIIQGVFGTDLQFVDDIEIGENIKTLFQEDHFKTFVSKEYEKELQQMLESSAGKGVTLGEFKEDFKDETIDRVAMHSMLELLETDFISAQFYLKLATNLTESVRMFLETGRFEEILEIYNTLAAHALTGRFRHEASSAVEHFFRSASFTTQCIEAIRIWGRRDRMSAFRIARALRHSLVEPLLDSLAEESDTSTRKFLLSLLSEFGSDIAPHVIRRLHDERWYIARNMLYLIRETNASQYAEQVRKFAKHENVLLCAEAVKTLLHFRTPDALPYLKLHIKSKDTEMRNRAVKLAGKFRVKEVVPNLLMLLDKKDLLGTESFYNRDVIRALGEIGDERAVPSLLKICKAQTLFYRSTLQDLKVDIYKNLENYPYHTLKALLEYGLSSRNKEIHALTEALMKRHQEPSVDGGSNRAR